LALLAFGQPAPVTSAQGASVGGGPAPAGGGGTGSAGAGASGSTGATGTGGAALGAAAGVGASFLSSGINDLLARSVLPIQASVRSGSSTSAAASLQVSERMRLEYIHQFGAAQYGQERADVNLLSLDWRFRPTWLLRTLIGDRGSTSLEVEWQHWY
jgi:hypothetical protein